MAKFILLLFALSISILIFSNFGGEIREIKDKAVKTLTPEQRFIKNITTHVADYLAGNGLQKKVTIIDIQYSKNKKLTSVLLGYSLDVAQDTISKELSDRIDDLGDVDEVIVHFVKSQ